MKNYSTKVSLNDHSTIDPKSTERYVIRDATFALTQLSPYQLINSITAQTAGGKGRTQ